MIQFISAGISIVAVTYGLARYVYGLFLPAIQSDLYLSTQTMGMIASISYIGYLVATAIGTYISAMTGPRLPIVLGGIAATIGMGGIAFSQSAGMLALGVFIAGTSAGFSYPPLSDAIVQAVKSKSRSKVYAWINTGTSFGIMAAGPIVLIFGAEWRLSWITFSLLALGATCFNYFQMPSKMEHNQKGSMLPSISLEWYLKKESLPLFFTATGFGILTSVYWTFSVDLIATKGDFSQLNISIFWVLVGISGIGGGAAGFLVEYWGLRGVFQIFIILISVSMAMLSYFYDQVMVGFISAFLFGASFITMTALLGIWSVYIFDSRPSAGFGATFFLLSLGQFIGPMFAGFIGEIYGLPILFILSGMICWGLIPLAPTYDVRSMTSI